MSTVRIYKVAELLDTTSQEVLALLKRDHGIELKSASSTIEEVVARSFVERVARQRSISLPGGDMFAEHPVPAKGAKKAPAPKKAEPPKPTAPVLGPPRLVKTIRPAVPPAETTPAPAPPPEDDEPLIVEEPAAVVHPPAPEPEPVQPVAAAPEVAPPPSIEEPAPSAPLVVEDVPIDEPTPDMPAVAAQAPAASPAGRFVPPTIRLRIEEPGRTPQPSRPLAPAKRPQVSQPRMLKPPAPPAPGATAKPQPAGAKPAGAARPGAPGQARPPYSPPPRPTTPGMLGGPRPLPSQPVRTQQPGAPRPGMPSAPGQRPPFGQQRPPFGQQRPGTRPTQTRRERPSAPQMSAAPAAPPPITRTITLAEGMTVKDLADKLDVRVKDVLAKLLMKRMMMTINSTMDVEVAKDLAREFGAEIEMRSFEQELVSAEGDESLPEDVKGRAPVVTVMGHVDHGKTSLLDAIRETKVAEREAGGITQHIGAYHVDVGDGRSVVFLDTPGHEAFTLMRARGAKVTDVVVLVVAADDGVMPQTREAIDHAKAANVPIVVAINKIDKPGVNPDNVKRQLAELSLVPEDWGGQTVMVPVSAKKRQNLDQLLEMILLSTDILELRANPEAQRVGYGARSQARSRPRPRRDGARAGRHAQRRRQLHRWPGRRQGPRADRRSRPADEVGRPVDASRSARSHQPAAARRSVPDGRRRREGAADRDLPAVAGQGARARAPRADGSRSNRSRNRSPKAA